MKENEAQYYMYMYNHNTIQYYQTLFDNAVKIFKTQFYVNITLHSTTLHKNISEKQQIQIRCMKKVKLSSAKKSSII